MVVVLIYVDDIIITGNNLIKIQETKKQLDDEFNIKDRGKLDILEDSGKLRYDPRNNHLQTANRVLRYLKATPGQGILLSRAGDPRTKKQSVVSRSSVEAEYRAMASTVSEIIWVRWLLSELHVHNPLVTPLFCDNQAAWHIANNPVFHERTKHIEMECYFVRERVESKEIIPTKISSKMKIADLLTKGLPAHQHQFLLGKIGITDLHAPS
ncbi:uncharacterized mitochondrial protein-like protein [Tanacetum coccineum]